MSLTDACTRKNLGRIVFIVLLLFIGAIVLMYVQGTETMGIEERFSSALGISQYEEEHEHDGEGGFTLEGSPVLYVLVLAVLGIAGLVLFRKFGA